MADTPAAAIEVSLTDFRNNEKKFAASKRAQRRWRLLKNVRMATRRTSLTKPESDLLKAIGKKKKEAPDAATASAAATEAGSDNAKSAISAISENDSAARRRLRSSICLHRDSLSTTESSFLRDLLEADDVSDEAVANTADVLERDVIFKQKLSAETNVGVSAAARRRRRSSALSSSSVSGGRRRSSLLMASIPELEVNETPEKDIGYRKELWRTLQCSTVGNKLSAEKDKEDELEKEVVKPPASEELPLMSLFKKYVDVSSFSSQTSDTEAESSSSSDEEREDKQECPAEEGKTKTPSPARAAFSVLGMSPTDDSVTGFRVMTPPLMDTLRHYMPYAIQEDNFWLKYSLDEDGASIDTLLYKVRSSAHTILAIETTEGEVFGSFTSSPWRHMGPTYYGSCEAFLWRLAGSRRAPCATVMDRAKIESDVEVFEWTGENRNIQMSNPKTLAVGGGEPDKVIERRLLSGKPSSGVDGNAKDKWADFGLALNSDLSSGTSGRCVTFGSTSGLPRDGSPFEVQNAEVWTLTPMTDVQQAEKLELGRQFVFNAVTAKPAIKPTQRKKMAMAA